ncbi:hypothetical protein FH972_005933 [Carpinus fangiana]|uniref:Uncharacterized protein n=1 Tax=Carpinus fangiana TaxID=176857 RepID=A0A5N6QT58_9ROSI|nr:hypothetical protein FH972_005933 [Carpinus fangiana]
MAMLSSGLEKVLFSKNRLVKLVRLLIENGIGPEKLLVERSRRTKRVNWVKLGGNPPESALFWSMRAHAQEREQLGGRRGEEEGGGIFEGEGKKRKPWYPHGVVWSSR